MPCRLCSVSEPFPIGMLSQFQRLPVLKSEMVGLETITKRDLEMDFGDSFDPFEAPEVPPTLCLSPLEPVSFHFQVNLELHAMVEAKLKL